MPVEDVPSARPAVGVNRRRRSAVGEGRRLFAAPSTSLRVKLRVTVFQVLSGKYLGAPHFDNTFSFIAIKRSAVHLLMFQMAHGKRLLVAFPQRSCVGMFQMAHGKRLLVAFPQRSCVGMFQMAHGKRLLKQKSRPSGQPLQFLVRFDLSLVFQSYRPDCPCTFLVLNNLYENQKANQDKDK
jgi:hypothetical protein